jgi:Putative transposase
MVTSIQRFGGAVNTHLHFHTIVLDGVFVREPDGTLRFHPASRYGAGEDPANVRDGDVL